MVERDTSHRASLRRKATDTIALAMLVALCGSCGGEGPSDPPQSAEAPRDEVRRNPAEPEAHRRLGLVLRRAGHADEGLEHLEKAVELTPQSEDALLSLGIAYSSAGRLDDAEAIYERLLAVAPGHAKTLNNLANIAIRRGE